MAFCPAILISWPIDRWTWIDALYMAPPALALLTQATGKEHYLRFVDREFKPVVDTLYDPQAKLGRGMEIATHFPAPLRSVAPRLV